MDVKTALKEQYRAGLAMLRQCVELCPDDLWTAGTHPRTFWRIALHAVFFTQYGLGQNDAAWTPWPGRREGVYPGMWESPAYVEPYELPEGVEAMPKTEMLDYIAYVDELVNPMIDKLDLDTDYSGFPWYDDISKMSHQLMNMRHLHMHVGQLSELLMARGIDIDWVHRA